MDDFFIKDVELLKKYTYIWRPRGAIVKLKKLKKKEKQKRKRKQK